MTFNSLTGVVFLLVFFPIFYALSGKRRLYFVLAASALFYGWWDFRFLGLLAFSTTLDWWIGLRLERQRELGARKRLITTSVVANLCILGFFKYFNFFAEGLRHAAAALGIATSPVTLNIILPIGISFYTFQSMAYTIDVYRSRIQAEKSLVFFATYVSFFPQLVAGPIGRAEQIFPALRSCGRPRPEQLQEAVALLLLGYFQKVVIADNLAFIVNYTFNSGAHQTSMGYPVFMALVAFYLQIYGDFAGYSNIARGLAKLCGVELMVNFRQPLLADCPSDFWRRWHISLSTWLRDYLYIPLGGNRKGPVRTYLNLGLTMLLGGLWHGAAATFVLWGLYQGLLLVAHRLWRDSLGGRGAGVPRALAVPVTFLLTLYGWLIFRANSVGQLIDFTRQLFSRWTIPPLALSGAFPDYLGGIYLFWVLLFFVVTLGIDLVLETSANPPQLKLLREGRQARVAWAALACAGLGIIFFAAPRAPFIYFQF